MKNKLFLILAAVIFSGCNLQPDPNFIQIGQVLSEVSEEYGEWDLLLKRGKQATLQYSDKLIFLSCDESGWEKSGLLHYESFN